MDPTVIGLAALPTAANFAGGSAAKGLGMASSRVWTFAGVGAALGVLLPRMRREFDAAGRLSTTTAATMWACYLAAGSLYADALRRGRPPSRLAGAAGAAVAVAGLAMTTAGMSAFDTAGQVTGTRQGALAVEGVYRISRNPQYVGMVVAATAGAVARRSPLALAIAAGYAAVCRWWVRVEERTLERRFGDDYRGFRAGTPRWLALRAPRSRTPPHPDARLLV